MSTSQLKSYGFDYWPLQCFNIFISLVFNAVLTTRKSHFQDGGQQYGGRAPCYHSMVFFRPCRRWTRTHSKHIGERLQSHRTALMH